MYCISNLQRGFLGEIYQGANTGWELHLHKNPWASQQIIMNMIRVRRIYCNPAKLDLWLLLTIYTKDQVCLHLTLFVDCSFGTSFFCIFNKSKENPNRPRAFLPSHPALPSYPLQKPPQSLLKWFLWSILLFCFQHVKEKSQLLWSLSTVDPSWWWNPPWKEMPLRFDSIHPSIILWFILWLTNRWAVCGIQLVLMKWKHTLKVTKWQTHTASFMTHDYINHFDISIQNPPQKQMPLRFDSIHSSIILWFISWLTNSVQYVVCN
jgi:hypothetical protein